MSDDHPDIDRRELEELFAERARWASLDITIQEIADENKVLIHDFSHYDPKIAIPLLSSLLTLPEYQTQCIRLEVLVALAVVHCKGTKKAKVKDVSRWFSLMGESKCALGEDPAEDVFVSLSHDENGNYRLLEGIWEGAGFYTQLVLDVISTMPNDGRFGQLKRSFHALLVISDMICEKAGLQRYQLGSEEEHKTLSPRKIPKRNALISNVTITFEELDARGVSPDDITPFIFYPLMRDELPAQKIGCSYLDHHPLIIYSGNCITVALPTALSVAMRDFAIEAIVEGGLIEVFNGELARNYAKIIFDTPLLGGPMRAPVVWKKIGEHRLSNIVTEIDQGYFISYHFFLMSVDVHKYGGFKTVYEDDGTLTDALQKTINTVIEKVSEQSGFKEGLIITVGCGWGKGYATKMINIDYPKWRFQSMSVADIIRLSWLDDISPSYFWRIQDGLDAISNGGINIINPNGILNLIGWVRSNDGHFVPHAELPEGEISLERPLMLYPPLNLIREVRADSDLGYDRHRALDNNGIWHDVQHISPNPFFSRESDRCLYGSVDDVNAGMLTSVYEGVCTLWLTLAVPNISDREVTHHLWKMANEWLHRIGDEFDKYAVELKKTEIYRVYVEFYDSEPPERPGNKPKAEDLIPLCAVTEHEERNACKAVFKEGFLAGFGLAKNTAERLFAHNLTHAYFHLLDIEDADCKASIVTNSVVPNHDARSFHLFHAQKFMDYVRDSLPKTLVTVDKLDDAAVKIGLGWRVANKSHGNKIEGRNACTCFLGKVVDELLREIIDAFAAFERISTLKRLVANNEKASTEQDHWRRTSAALMGLHGDKEDTTNNYIEQISIFAGASITSRVLTEIALCACPRDHGVRISDIELSKLIARASLVVRIGGLSNAIYYNALPPEITISPLGDILFQDDFGRLVVQPMLSRALGDKFTSEASSQKKNYDEPTFIDNTQEIFESEFWCAWKKEMGFDLDEARVIIGALEDKGIRDNTAVFTIRRSEFIETACAASASKLSVENFLAQFTLLTRKRWDKPPRGFEIDDIEPWRFGRRLSFVVRPILNVDQLDDPLLIVAPNALRQGFAYIVDGAYKGRFKQSFFQSKEMRDLWWGKASEGHSFNADAARHLSDAGWTVRENIELPEILNQKVNKDFGDIDILAWRNNRREILVVECKDLSFARNYSEVAALLSDYQGKDNAKGKSDKLKMHLTRVSMVENNIDQLQNFTEVQEPRVISCLVCSGIVPMQYSKIDALVDTHVGSVEDIIKIVNG